MDYIIILLLIVLIALLVKNSQKPNNDSLDQKFKDIANELNSSFKNLSNEVLVNQSDKSLEKIKTSLNDVLDNFNKSQSDKFKVLDDSSKNLLSKISEHKELADIMRSQNDKFSQILSSPGPRGDWGELRIRTVLESAGLEEGIHFVHNKKTETSKDRPDYVVNLHDKKKLIIDSKFPYTAFSEKIDTLDKNERKELNKKHAKETRNMMEALSKKEYWNQYSDVLPFVIMALPTEELLYSAFQGDESLFNDSVEKNVYLCSPLNLLAMMNLIVQGHTRVDLNENAQKLIAVAKALINESATFNEKFRKMTYHAEELVKHQRSASKNLTNKMIPGLEEMIGMGATLEKGKKLNPGIKLVEEVPHQIDESDSEEE